RPRPDRRRPCSRCSLRCSSRYRPRLGRPPPRRDLPGPPMVRACTVPRGTSAYHAAAGSPGRVPRAKERVSVTTSDTRLTVDRRRFMGYLLGGATVVAAADLGLLQGDRKSTRLNSSHVKISYAVFCLKKK